MRKKRQSDISLYYGNELKALLTESKGCGLDCARKNIVEIVFICVAVVWLLLGDCEGSGLCVALIPGNEFSNMRVS